jgi:hypothetical protein
MQYLYRSRTSEEEAEDRMSLEWRQSAETSSDGEEEVKAPEMTLEINDRVQFRSVLHRILESNLPLSNQNPGYLLGFLNMVKSEEEISNEIENCLPFLLKAAKTWSYNTSKASKKGVNEYLESCKGLMASSYAMCFGSTIKKSLKTLLESYKQIDISEEDCSKLVENLHTSMSSTTAHGATDTAGATGGKKRKHTDMTLDEIEVDIDEIAVNLVPLPTFKTYSSTIARKEGKQYIKRLEEPWSDFQARVTIYRTQDLLECPKSSEKWKYKYQELELNYKIGSPLFRMMNQIKGTHMARLEAKGVVWETKKEYKFE